MALLRRLAHLPFDVQITCLCKSAHGVQILPDVQFWSCMYKWGSGCNLAPAYQLERIHICFQVSAYTNDFFLNVKDFYHMPLSLLTVILRRVIPGPKALLFLYNRVPERHKLFLPVSSVTKSCPFCHSTFKILHNF